MSILIDELIQKEHDKKEVCHRWYIVKPSDNLSFKQRFKDALNVLYGNARAFHYFDDEANTWGEVR